MSSPEGTTVGYGDWPGWLALALAFAVFIWQIFQQMQLNRLNITTKKINSLNQIVNCLDDIASSSRIYWLNDEENVKKESETLLFDFKKLNDIVTMVQENHKELLWLHIKSDIRKLRTIVIGGDFQKSERAATPSKDPSLEKIRDAITAFRSEVSSIIEKI